MTKSGVRAFSDLEPGELISAVEALDWATDMERSGAINGAALIRHYVSRASRLREVLYLVAAHNYEMTPQEIDDEITRIEGGLPPKEF